MEARFRGHYLKGNERCEQPSQCIFVDTETYQHEINSQSILGSGLHRFRLGVAIAVRRKANQWYGRTVHHFERVGDFWTWLHSRVRSREPAYIFAHNWHYDAQSLGFWQRIDEGSVRVTMPQMRSDLDNANGQHAGRRWVGLLAIENHPFIVRCLFGKGAIALVDTCNYWPVPLHKLGEENDTDKRRMPRFEDAHSEWASYCQRDCEIIEKAVCGTMDVWRSLDLGNWQLTGAKLSHSCYRHLCIESPRSRRNYDDGKTNSGNRKLANHAICNHKHGRCKRLERYGYFGGEVRTWFRGIMEQSIFHVDISGMYPSVMRDGLFPTRLEEYRDDDAIKIELVAEHALQSIAEVVIDSPWRDCPKRCGRIVRFPAGRFATVLCGNELGAAISSGEVAKVNRWARYSVGPIFKEFINYWWQQRMESRRTGNYALESLSKLIMIGLPGKFAQRRVRWEIVPDVIPPIRWGTFVRPVEGQPGFQLWRAIGGVAQRQTEQPHGRDRPDSDWYADNTADEIDPWEKEDTFVAISAFITSAARHRMRLARDVLPVKSCLAQMTDAFLLTEDGYDAINQSKFWNPGQLGMFRLHDEYQWIQMFDALHYRTDKGECMAGISGNRVATSDYAFKVCTPDKTPAVISRNPSRYIRWNERLVTLNWQYLDGVYGGDGWWLGDKPDQERIDAHSIMDGPAMLTEPKGSTQLNLFG